MNHKVALNKPFWALFSMMMLVLSSLAWTTYAWFTRVATGSISVTDLVVRSYDTISQVAVYPYHVLDENDTQPAEGSYTFSKTPLANANLMGNYSILKQKENALLLELTLTDYAKSLSSLQLSAHTLATIYLGQLNEESHKLIQPLQLTGNSLTSIICFYSFTSLTDYGTYSSVLPSATLNQNSDKMSFVSDKAIIEDLVICDIATQPNKIYIVLDYDIESIEDIYSANIGNETITQLDNPSEDGQTYLTYTSDFLFAVTPKGS